MVYSPRPAATDPALAADRTRRMVVRPWRAVLRHEFRRDAAASGLRERVVRFPDGLPGFPSAGLRRPPGLALAGAGLALTAAVAFATFIKVFGIGLFGRGNHNVIRFACQRGRLGRNSRAPRSGAGCGHAGLVQALNGATLAEFGVDSALRMHDGLPLVAVDRESSRSSRRASWSSSCRCCRLCRSACWFQPRLGREARAGLVRRRPAERGGTGTTALTFSNALRTFYSFIYRPTAETEREGQPAAKYFVTRFVFNADVAPVFGPYLFRANLSAWSRYVADRARILQSGRLEFLSRSDRLAVGDHSRIWPALTNERNDRRIVDVSRYCDGRHFRLLGALCHDQSRSGDLWARFSLCNIVINYSLLPDGIPVRRDPGAADDLPRAPHRYPDRFIGGFSTFSTFAMETLLLAEQGEHQQERLYVVLSVFRFHAAFGGASSREISSEGRPWKPT